MRIRKLRSAVLAVALVAGPLAGRAAMAPAAHAATCDVTLTGGEGQATLHNLGNVCVSGSVVLMGHGYPDYGTEDPNYNWASVTIGPGSSLTLGGAKNDVCNGVTSGTPLTLTVANGGTNAGALSLFTNSTCFEGGPSALVIGGGATLFNSGRLDAVLCEGDPIGCRGGHRFVQGNVTNTGTVSVADSTYHSGPGTFDNQGSFYVDSHPGTEFHVTRGPGAFVNDAGGSISNFGTFAIDDGNRFVQGAGTIASAPASPIVVAGSALAYTGAGAGTILARGGVTLSGAISPGQTLRIATGECPDVGAHVTTSGSVTNGGIIEVVDTGTNCGGGTLSLTIPSGATLTNAGTLTVAPPGSNQLNFELSGPVVNLGVMTMANGNIQYLGRSFDNRGQLTLNRADEPTFSVNGGPNAVFTNDAGGSIASNGAPGRRQFAIFGGVFRQGTGTTTGNPVWVVGGKLTYFGAGAGAITLNDGVTLSGSIAAGQALTLDTGQYGSFGCSAQVTTAGSFTNAGTITFGSHAFGCGNSSPTLTLPAGGKLTNTGTLSTAGVSGEVHGSVANRGRWAVGYSTKLSLFGPFTRTAGTTDIGTGAILEMNGFPMAIKGGTVTSPPGNYYHSRIADTTLTNSGGVIIPGGDGIGALQIQGDYVQGPGGTLRSDIQGTGQGNTYDLLGVSGQASLDGTLAVRSSRFSPSVGQTLQVVSSSSEGGRFASVKGNILSGGIGYQLSYGSSGVFLTAVQTVDAALTMTAPTSANVGQQITYTLKVRNAGTAPALDVNLTDTLPAQVSVVSAASGQGNCSGSTTVTCNIGTLNATPLVTVTIVATAHQVGTAVNRATVATSSLDSNSANNTRQVTTAIQP